MPYEVARLVTFVTILLILLGYLANSGNILGTQGEQSASALNITSHIEGQKVPLTHLTISGTSTDTINTDCQVYVKRDRLAPLQKAVAAGINGPNDFSKWTYTYSAAYNVLTLGNSNELTAELSCFGAPADNKTALDTVHVVGVKSLKKEQVQPVKTISNVSGVSDIQSTNCTKLDVANTTASGFETDPADYHPPPDAVDGDSSTWWSNLARGSWISLDLGNSSKICNIEISWHKGDERKNDFVIATSTDGITFTDIFSGKSTGKSISPEKYDINSDSTSQYLKITITKNTSKKGWASIREISVSGKLDSGQQQLPHTVLVDKEICPPSHNQPDSNRLDGANNSNKGIIILRKVNLDSGKLIPDSVFRITPNPFTLQDSITIQDNIAAATDVTINTTTPATTKTENIDCNPTGGVTQLNNVQLSTYKIQEINSSNGVVLHEFTVAINDKLSNMSFNIVNRELGVPLADIKVPNQFILILNDGISDDPQLIANQIVSNSRGAVKVLQVYDEGVKGIAIQVADQKLLDAILLDPRIASVEQDRIGHIASATNLNQTLPLGIGRVGAGPSISSDNDNGTVGVSTNGSNVIVPLTPAADNARNVNVDVDIAILDTGISLTHPDLNVYREVTFVQNTTSGDDDQGHGSHVAGIAAAKDNSIGVVGIAPGARLWAIKVCDKFGSCLLSDLIQAVEYVTEHADQIDVVNISIENPHSATLNKAIADSVAAGVTYVVAAGNSGIDASSTTSPADAPDAITVSAVGDSDGKCGGIGRPTYIGKDDSFAKFSNFGSVVDIAAPGVDIHSTYNGTEYGLDSGTSMAAPHVAGAVASYKAVHPDASPEEIRSWLKHSGSIGTTVCDGKAHGYFSGDPDGFAEPMLYASIE
jgi:hypothetical protein